MPDICFGYMLSRDHISHVKPDLWVPEFCLEFSEETQWLPPTTNSKGLLDPGSQMEILMAKTFIQVFLLRWFKTQMNFGQPAKP